MSDQIIFNEKLTFSWGHVIAFVALIAIAYCTFIGSVYLLAGEFIVSGIIAFLVVLVLGLWFTTAQQLKSTSRKFAKRIKWERFFVFLSPVVFLVMMIPFYHSWSVHYRQDKIVSLFNYLAANATGTFLDYEQYVSLRKSDYDTVLQQSNYDSISIRNKKETLHLILLSSNYDTLKTSSTNWMNKATEDEISTWNIFLLGNVAEIKDAVESWHRDLQGFSKVRLSDENTSEIFDARSVWIKSSQNCFDDLCSCYKDIKCFNPIVLIWLLLCYFMLIFPYVIQNRNAKTTGLNYSLWGFMRGDEKNSKSAEYISSDDLTLEIEKMPDSKSDLNTSADTKNDFDIFNF